MPPVQVGTMGRRCMSRSQSRLCLQRRMGAIMMTGITMTTMIMMMTVTTMITMAVMMIKFFQKNISGYPGFSQFLP